MKEPFSHVRPWDYDLYTCADYDASEDEVVQFIGSLVYLLKPLDVVEIGTHRGYTASAIQTALKRNGKGHLHTFEVSAELVGEASQLIDPSWVTIHHADGNAPDAETEMSRLGVDILFIDGHLENRYASFWKWGPRVKKGGYIIVHDSLKYPEVGRQIDQMRDDLYLYAEDLQTIDFLTPRGLTIFRVPNS